MGKDAVELKPGCRKRQVQAVDTNSMEAHITGPEARARTVPVEEIPEWQQDNKYIIRGYRLAKADYVEVFTSLTFLHNETCNVYSHLIGALLLPIIAAVFLWSLSATRFHNVLATDYVMFAFFFCCAECCLVFSTLYHLLGCHSQEVDQFWLQMDLLGIIIVTVGTFVPGIYYLFTCEPKLQKIHWAVVGYSQS